MILIEGRPSRLESLARLWRIPRCGQQHCGLREIVSCGNQKGETIFTIRMRVTFGSEIIMLPYLDLRVNLGLTKIVFGTASSLPDLEYNDSLSRGKALIGN